MNKEDYPVLDESEINGLICLAKLDNKATFIEQANAHIRFAIDTMLEDKKNDIEHRVQKIESALTEKARTGILILKNRWKVEFLVDEDKHLNIYVLNDDGSSISEVETGQGDGSNGEQYAIRFTTGAIEKEYQLQQEI